MKNSNKVFPEWGFLIVLLLTFLTPATIISQQTFEEYQKQQEQGLAIALEDDSLAFSSYKTDIEKKWQQFLSSTQEEWISYSEGKETKRVVNFEEGYIEIETLVDKTEPEPLKKAQQQIADQVKELVLEDDGSGKAILSEQVSTSDGKEVTNRNVAKFAQEVAVKAEAITPYAGGEDKIERMIVTVRIPMVPDHLRKRAEIYLPVVRSYCDKYDLDIAMVMALIHTESYFNPKAKSNAPAFGLMQLVPKSGGKEAYKYVFGKDQAPGIYYLYNPENNIQLGAAYLRKMRTTEFKNVTDSQNALYCIICAYNTGPRYKNRCRKASVFVFLGERGKLTFIMHLARI